MPFFQNPFAEDFKGPSLVDDRKYIQNYDCPANKGRGADIVMTWVKGPFDMSGNDADGNPTSNLTITFAHGPNLNLFANLTINVAASAAVVTAVTPAEIIAALNADDLFASRFEASITSFDGTQATSGPESRVIIRSTLHSNTEMIFFIANGGAETLLRFNQHAGVCELPWYYLRHIVGSIHTYPASVTKLIPLGHLIESCTSANPGVITSTNHGLTTGDSILIANSDTDATLDGTRTATVLTADTFSVAVDTTTQGGTRGVWMTGVEQDVINNAVDFRGNSLGYTAADVRDDYELLQGASPTYLFTSNVVDGSNRVTRKIEYPAGAEVGDAAKLTLFTYTGANTEPDQITIEPYVLQSGDLITPY